MVNIETFPSFCTNDTVYLLPPTPNEKLTIVLDLDETLIYARDEICILKRPYLDNFINVLKNLNCEIVIWTAAEHSYALEVLKHINILSIVSHFIWRHKKWINYLSYETTCAKPICMLGRNKVIVIENSICSVMCNSAQSIIVNNFERISYSCDDNTLILISNILTDLNLSDKSVEDFLSSRKELQCTYLQHLKYFFLTL
jgi:TFIIF-interacting CTD phosphatase-like protein